MDSLFEFLADARSEFISSVRKQKWDDELKRSADEMLTAFDQAVLNLEKIERFTFIFRGTNTELQLFIKTLKEFVPSADLVLGQKKLVHREKDMREYEWPCTINRDVYTAFKTGMILSTIYTTNKK